MIAEQKKTTTEKGGPCGYCGHWVAKDKQVHPHYFHEECQAIHHHDLEDDCCGPKN